MTSASLPLSSGKNQFTGKIRTNNWPIRIYNKPLNLIYFLILRWFVQIRPHFFQKRL